MSARKKTTFYVEESLHKALRIKAANDDVSPSDLINQILTEDLTDYLEDIEDVATAKARRKERGKGMKLDDFVKKLSKNV